MIIKIIVAYLIGFGFMWMFFRGATRLERQQEKLKQKNEE